MTKQPSPRLDALRTMREETYNRATAAKREIDRATAALDKRKKEDAILDLQAKTVQAAAHADDAIKRRKAKKKMRRRHAAI